MFDIFRLKEVLVQYKEVFVSEQWPNEKYKWEAVKCFQDNWDVNASDFADMLTRSLAKTYNLLASMNNFPARMITGFAKVAPEEVRAMFIALFDESNDVVTRILDFKNQSSILLEKYGNGAGQHYQYENAVSTYLWMRYPDKYYIYKYGEVKAVADELGSGLHFKKGAYADNLRNFYTLYNEICAELQKDGGLADLMKSQISDTCYPDPELRTLTIDVGFFVSRRISSPKTPGAVVEQWWPTDYSPELSVEDWVGLLGDAEVFTVSSLEIMKRMKDYGGQATCKQLSVKYGESVNFYISGSATLAKRVAEKSGCPIMPRDEENSRWWPILYLGKDAKKDEDGSYVWRLRDELSAALDQVNLDDVALYVQAAPGEEEHNYWWLNAKPTIWSFADVAVGETQSFTLYNENGNKRRIFQNFIDAKAGDMVIGYESYPSKQIVALAKVCAEQDGEKIYFEKVEGFATPIDYQVLKACPELEKMEFFANPTGTLFRLTKGEYDFIMDLIREDKPLCDVSPMVYGNKPADGGNLIIEDADYEEFIKRDPGAQKFIKPLLGAVEYLHGKKRWCLWLEGVSPTEIKKCPLVYERVIRCKENRENSVAAAIRKFAETPTLFAQRTQPVGVPFIIIPRVSSQSRKYIPMGFLDGNTIVTDLVQIVPNASLYEFGVLTSNVHMAWMRTVCSRMKSDYRYIKDVVYNNFPWPTPTDMQKSKIEETAQAILDARAKYPECSLADLYNETLMPPELRTAHQKNDRAVMQAYGFWGKLNSEAECVAELMRMYQELTK